MRELLLGAGNSRERKVSIPGHEGPFQNLTTLDISPRANPQFVWDLNQTPWPFDDDTFDEVHAYEVLEHLGQQGDVESFFATFTEIWRILLDGGLLVGTSPMSDNPWTWGDPGHTRVISKESMTFLDQTEYTKQVGETAMSDYRSIYRADFSMLANSPVNDVSWAFILTAIKPSRYTP